MVQLYFRAAKILVIDSITGLKEAINRQRLVGILNVPKCIVLSAIHRNGNELAKLGEFNTTGVGLHHHAESRGSTF